MLSNIVVFGASGTIGRATLNHVKETYPNATIYGFSQRKVEDKIDGIRYGTIKYNDEESIINATKAILSTGDLDLVFVATGLLHEIDIAPEKSLRDLSFNNFNRIIEMNAAVPAMLAKHFMPKLSNSRKSIFAIMSARVGSISDNRLGGWYAYRMSKAAINMFIKCSSIEMKRLNKNAIVVGLHPGTVDSPLSKPFQKNVPQGKLFTPQYSVEMLFKVLDSLNTDDSGKIFAWDGEEINP